MPDDLDLTADREREGGVMAAKDDGSLYAQGRYVKHRPKRSATGISLGGTIAMATDEKLAAEIVRRCNAFEPMEAALRTAEEAFRRYALLHSAKRSEDGDAKALANDELAAVCRAALAHAHERA
jgi:hypothetical protein